MDWFIVFGLFATTALVIASYCMGSWTAMRYWQEEVQAAHRYEVEAEERAHAAEEMCEAWKSRWNAIQDRSAYILRSISEPAPDDDPSLWLGILAIRMQKERTRDRKRLGEIIWRLWGERDEAISGLARLQEARIKGMTGEGGVFTVEMQADVVPVIAALLADCLDAQGATNFVAWRLDHPTKGPLDMIIQRVYGKSPLDLRAEAVKERDALIALLSESHKANNPGVPEPNWVMMASAMQQSLDGHGGTIDEILTAIDSGTVAIEAKAFIEQASVEVQEEAVRLAAIDWDRVERALTEAKEAAATLNEARKIDPEAWNKPMDL
jgi:hypothetical protein